MANLEQRAPGISLRYTDSLNLQTMDDLREAGLDLILLPAGNFSPWVDWRPIFHASYVVVARQDHPVLRQHGVTPAAAMPVELYCSLRHAAFRVIEMAPDRETAALAALGLQREVVLSVPTFTAVLRSVAATNLVGIVPRRMAVKVAIAEGLAIHPLPFALPPTLLAMIWHRRNSASRAHTWLRDQVSEILTPLDDLEQSSVGSLVLGSAGNLD
ncbi:hypothetical protein HB774_27045 (plasmid) [Rhizobium leguminosarum bv. viciae]|nr:hypothetical protein HB774_27045 [Rhizobium leguminosarum bv. viciae]